MHDKLAIKRYYQDIIDNYIEKVAQAEANIRKAEHELEELHRLYKIAPKKIEEQDRLLRKTKALKDRPKLERIRALRKKLAELEAEVDSGS